MQHTITNQQKDKTHATQSNINKTIKPMQHTTKYQQNCKTHATHNQNTAKR